jgi:hypothetical protein
MAAPRLIVERRNSEARAIIGDMQAMLAIANLRWTDAVYIRTFAECHVTVIRLWEKTLTDGSLTYEFHLL